MLLPSVTIWLLCGMLAGHLYKNRGHSYATGFLCGLLLGPIGVVLTLLTPSAHRQEIKPQPKSYNATSKQPAKSPWTAPLVFGAVILFLILVFLFGPTLMFVLTGIIV